VEHLRLILDLNLKDLDGGTGQTWHSRRCAADLQANSAPVRRFDELVTDVAGQTATVSARAHREDPAGQANRYLDTYARRDGRWLCTHVCVWPLAGDNTDRLPS
jgi:hypothetical protein